MKVIDSKYYVTIVCLLIVFWATTICLAHASNKENIDTEAQISRPVVLDSQNVHDFFLNSRGRNADSESVAKKPAYLYALARAAQTGNMLGLYYFWRMLEEAYYQSYGFQDVPPPVFFTKARGLLQNQLSQVTHDPDWQHVLQFEDGNFNIIASLTKGASDQNTTFQELSTRIAILKKELENGHLGPALEKIQNLA